MVCMVSGRSAPVTQSRTPGRASARRGSTRRRWACAWALRTITACAMPDRTTSSTYRPPPVSRRGSSTRLIEVPTVFMRRFAGLYSTRVPVTRTRIRGRIGPATEGMAMTTPTIEPRMELEQHLHMYRQMAKIRAFDEQVNELYKSAKMPGLAHLYVGQEAVAVGVCEALRRDDFSTSTHRGHGHCLAKAAPVNPMFAELLGKESGYCRGKGGSMHIADPE